MTRIISAARRLDAWTKKWKAEMWIILCFNFLIGGAALFNICDYTDGERWLEPFIQSVLRSVRFDAVGVHLDGFGIMNRVGVSPVALALVLNLFFAPLLALNVVLLLFLRHRRLKRTGATAATARAGQAG